MSWSLEHVQGDTSGNTCFDNLGQNMTNNIGDEVGEGTVSNVVYLQCHFPTRTVQASSKKLGYS